MRKKILGYIKDIKEKNPNNANLIDILEAVSKFIDACKDDWDKEGLKKGLSYLEAIPLSSSSGLLGWIFPTKSLLREFLKKKKLPVLDPAEFSKAYASEATRLRFLPTLSQDDEAILSILVYIHTELMRHYPKLFYAFPQDATGQVMNDAIKEWQTAPQQTPSENSPNSQKASFRDFKRGYNILGQRIASNQGNQEIESMIGALVQRTGANDQDQDLLKRWLMKNGGQETNRFLDLLFLQGYFGKQFNIGITQALDLNWYVNNETGKICFSYVVLIKTLQEVEKTGTTEEEIPVAKDMMIARDDKGEVRRLDLNALTKEDEALLSKKDLIPPLIRVQALIELDVVPGAVVPKLVECNVFNYVDSPFLIKPSEVLLASSPRQQLF